MPGAKFAQLLDGYAVHENGTVVKHARLEDSLCVAHNALPSLPLIYLFVFADIIVPI